MAEDVLSQAELEALLSAMESGVASVADSSPAKSNATLQPRLSNLPTPGLKHQVHPRHAQGTELVGAKQIAALSSIHEAFSRGFAIALSAMLRNAVEVKLASVEQITFGEFSFRLENPTCFHVLRAAPLEGNLMLDMSPAILYPMIDRMLGGGREPGCIARRPLTEIELRLVARVTTLLLEELRCAWQNVVNLELSVRRVESNPQLVEAVPPNDAVIVINLELKIVESRGAIKLCIPWRSLEAVSGRLAGFNAMEEGHWTASSGGASPLGEEFQHSVVDVVAYLAESKISENEILNLRVGDIITTETGVHTPISVYVAGVPRFHAHPGAFQGQRAIEVEEMIGPSTSDGAS